MYQPYPSGDQPPAQPGAQPPGSVRIAALFMYAGAALSVVGAVLTVITIGASRDALRRLYPRFTDAQVHTAATAGLIASLVVAAIAVFLWLLVAWACRTGRNWGRMTGTVLFALNTVLLLFGLIRPGGAALPRATVGTLLTVLLWLAGLGAVVMLWRRDSSAFFGSTARRL